MADPLGQATGVLPSQGWNEFECILPPPPENLGTEAVQLAEATFLNFVVCLQVVPAGPLKKSPVQGRAPGSGKPAASDGRHASRIDEQRQAPGSRQASNQEVQPPTIPRIGWHVGVSEHPLDIPVGNVAARFLENLPPSCHDTLVASMISPGSGAGRPVMTVSVEDPSAAFAPLASPPKAKPNRRRKAHTNSGLVKRKAGVEGTVASQAPA